MARLIVFDLDGTLVDSSRDIASAVNAALARVGPGRAPLPFEAVLSFVGEGARTLVERCLRHAGLGLSPEEVLPVYLECYAERLLDTTRLYPGIEEALDGLTDPALAVLTNKPGDMSRVYSNFVHVPRKGERPEAAAPHFKVYSGMDLDYWKTYYLLGEAEEVADKIRAKIAALGGAERRPASR